MRKFVVVLAALACVSGAAMAYTGTGGGTGGRGGASNAGAPHGGGGYGGGGHRGGGHHGGGRGGGVIFVNPYGYWPYTIYPYPYPYSDAPDASYPPPGPPPPASAQDTANDMPPGPFWYYCDQPAGYYPYVKSCGHDWTALAIAPPPPGTGAPISDGTWSWCDDPKGYFPYVATCRRKWTSVPVTIPLSEGGPDGVPITADWFYCEDPAGYIPYVATCAKDWRAVPSIPPPNAENAGGPAGHRKKSPGDGGDRPPGLQEAGAGWRGKTYAGVLCWN